MATALLCGGAVRRKNEERKRVASNSGRMTSPCTNYLRGLEVNDPAATARPWRTRCPAISDT